ncbi:MAG: invasion associated locus B family protein [Roseovarius sp.]
MLRFLSTLPLIATLALGQAALAQDTTTEEPAANEDSAATETLDMGQPINEDPSYIKETYGDWQLQCFRSEAEEDPCQMYQLLREEAGNPVAEFSLFKLPGDAQAVAGATVVVPLGTLLPQGLKISVDDGRAKAYNYSFCSMVGCFARIGFTQEDIDAFKAGGEANLVIIPAQAPDQTVVIKASLDGFTKAYENVSIAPN